jgi:hypothetical protein
MQVTGDKRSIRRSERKYWTKLFFEPRRSIGLPSLHQGPGLPRFSRALATRSQCVRRATSSLLFHRTNAQESVLHCISPESLYCTRRASGWRKGRPRKRIFESGHHKMRTRSKVVCCCCWRGVRRSSSNRRERPNDVDVKEQRLDDRRCKSCMNICLLFLSAQTKYFIRNLLSPHACDARPTAAQDGQQKRQFFKMSPYIA